MDGSATPPLLLFGAFDRHNFGDLLFPHIAAALLPGREIAFAGLAERDLRALGGHRVQALATLALERRERPFDVLHVGGETLTCTAWQAAVMLLPGEPSELDASIAWLQRLPDDERKAWVRRMVGSDAQLPYVLDRERYPGLRGLVHAGVGGMAIDALDAAAREELRRALRSADAIGVREARTQALLVAEGIADALLLPDPAVLTAELFGARIAAHGAQGEPAQIAAAMPQGYLAVQLAAEFGDDATLDAIAAPLRRLCEETGLGLALFRAGAAPWHDSLDVLQRLASRLPKSVVRLMDSLQLWDICALIAASRGFVGSSLHGRIVAQAYALPRLNIRSPRLPAGQLGKHAAYAQSWEPAALPSEVELAALGTALPQALAADAQLLREHAAMLAQRYRAGFATLLAALPA
jgi:hypothetical protein